MAIAHVQSKGANSGASAAGSLNVVLDAAPTNGNLLILVTSSTSTPLTVASSADIGWFGGAKSNGSSNATQVFMGYVRTGSASATIALTLFSGTQPLAAVCSEFSGISQPQFDTSVAGTGTGSTLASGATPTTRTAAELWVAGLSSRANNTLTYSAPTNSFLIAAQTCTTITGANADRACALLYKIVSSTGTANAGATSDQSSSWVVYTVTIDAAASVPFQTSQIH